MDHKNPFFTIFTPVFNGEEHLSRIFESIKEQTFKNFEWIVIDDGSTDNTANLIGKFIIENPEISIIFFKQKNEGKHRSWNKAVDYAKGVLFIPADADDYFLPESLEFFYCNWNILSKENQLYYSGINVLCLDNDSNRIKGDKFPFDGYISTNLELYYRLNIKGEKWGCVRLDLLKLRKFPIFQGAYYPEGYLWMYFSKKNKVICYNKPLRKYYTSELGLTSLSSISKKSLKQIKIDLHYNFWILSNFSFYLIRYSLKEYLRIFFLIILNLFLLIKNLLKNQI